MQILKKKLESVCDKIHLDTDQ